MPEKRGLRAYKHERTQIIERLERISDFASAFTTDSDISAIKARYKVALNSFEEFNEIQASIESNVTSTELDAEGKERVNFENIYYETVGKIESILEIYESKKPIATATSANEIESVVNQRKIKLPTVKLPEFSGCFAEWLSFRDTFKTIIHENGNLTEIEKLYYLRSTLKDEALRAIESLTVASNNYKAAWELLQRRFENKRLIVQAHVRNILNVANVTKSDALLLRRLLDTVVSNLESLKVLGIPVENLDVFIVTLITEKLDFHTNKEWQCKLNSEIPTFAQLEKFLETRCQYLESLNQGSGHLKQSHFQTKQKYPRSSVTNVSNSSSKYYCALCKKSNHALHQCNKFCKLPISARIEKANELNVCKVCLRVGHDVANCKSDIKCRQCHAKHNALVHVEEATHITESPTTSNNNHCNTYVSEGLLSTAVIYIQNNIGQFIKCRALLDNGSQSNFITKDLCCQLGITSKKINHQITGINMSLGKVTDIVQITIKSRFTAFQAKINCLVLSTITQNLPLLSFPASELNIPENVNLADEQFSESRKIDLLLGTQLFLQLLYSGKIQLQPHKVYLQNTALGWIIGGSINVDGCLFSACNLALNTDTDSENFLLNNQIAKFWELEGVDTDYNLSNDPSEKHFVQSVRRTEGGRFIVSLPTKNEHVDLGDSFVMAKRRFQALENKLNRNKELQHNYIEFMREYIELGHMERVPDHEVNKQNVYYIPHHAVFKDDKIRVVFDASAKSANHKSLNDNLLIGITNLQQDILSILTRFRTYNIVLKADIRKMYRQILLNPHETDYQRILWRESSFLPLEIYRLLTVTYGVASAPFLAVRVLHQLAYENASRFPEASNVLLRDFYMDDVITGCNTQSEALVLREQLTQILKSGGFELAKWASNNKAVISNTNDRSMQDAILDLDKGSNTKTLGLYWDSKDDFLHYMIRNSNNNTNLTKRAILSTISQIYDPLGLIGPIIVKAKLIMQNLWQQKSDWDVVVPTDIKSAWLELVDDIKNLTNMHIPRNVVVLNSTNIELHGFADASERAYGAALYIRCTTDKGSICSNLLVAKSRVAPLKVLTIPRLELLAALLLTKLYNRVVKTLNVYFDKIYLYTDSQIVLAWISKPAATWKVFVANRVLEIQQLTKNVCWRHVRSEENPADLISRGASTNCLLTSNLWWHGPQFLNNSLENVTSKTDTVYLNIEEIPEVKQCAVVNTAVSVDKLDIFEKFSDLVKLMRCKAWILRFINNCRNKTKVASATLSVIELQNAHTNLIKLVQREVFSTEINELKLNNAVHKSSALANMSPFLDKDEIIRVGGRLRNAPLAFDKKHQIILPKNHDLTKMIIRHFHVVNLHSGAQGTLAAIRQKYWVISGRSAVRSVLHKCVSCFRARPIVAEQKMGDLPQHRVEQLRPFLKTGIDYCGPIFIKEGRGRGKKSVKAYIALFICLCTKAVHLELVSDLTTEGFLNALRRFMSRRGNVKEMHSDNATNFVGAKNELLELKNILKNQDSKRKVIDYLGNNNVSWHFIPPRSPNFGGLWEANIRAVKYHIKRVIGETLLTFEELYTFITRVEACLNSRPLLPLSTDPNDLNALTPGHFLIGEPLTAPTEADLGEIKINRLSRWQLVERLRQHFWQRWHQEYIRQLQARSKWKSPSFKIEPGTMVLLLEEGIPPQQWLLGRVHEVHPGKDGLVRVATIKTAKGLFKRGISKLCVLPTES